MEIIIKRAMYRSIYTWIVCICLTGCNKFQINEIPDPDPMPPAVKMQTITLTATIEALEGDSTIQGLTVWNKDIELIVSSLDKEGRLLNKKSYAGNPTLQGSLFRKTSDLNAPTATFEGQVVEGADSLVAYVFYNGLQRNLAIQHWSETKETMYDILLNGYKNNVGDLSLTLQHQSNQLNIKLINKTNTPLSLTNMTMELVDRSSPFYSHTISFLGRHLGKETTNTTLLNFSDKRLPNDSSVVANLSMYLTDTTALAGKAIRYTIKTNKGTYIYTKTGKTYARGRIYEDEIVLEGV